MGKTKMHYAQPNKAMMEFLRANVKTQRPRCLSVAVKHALERMRIEERAMERVLDAEHVLRHLDKNTPPEAKRP